MKFAPALTLTVLATLCFAVPAATQAETAKARTTPCDTTRPILDGHQVVERMLETYASLERYWDDGRVVDEFKGPRPFESEIFFSTAYQRDGDFRFQFTRLPLPSVGGDNISYMVWSTADEVFSWSTVGERVYGEPSLRNALGGPTGVSSGAAVMIPGFLDPELEWRGPRSLRCPRVVGIEEIDGVSCYRVDAYVARDAPPWTFWIERDRFLLRRIVETSHNDRGSVVTTMSFTPFVGEEVPDAMFRVSPSREGVAEALTLSWPATPEGVMLVAAVPWP